MKKRSRLRSMRVSTGFRSFVLDQLASVGDVTPKEMFGGIGLYSGGVFFGILASDVLYLKVDETNRTDFERAGSKPFTPYADRMGTMQYWSVPIGILESAPELAAWTLKAIAVAERAREAQARPARAKAARRSRRKVGLKRR